MCRNRKRNCFTGSEGHRSCIASASVRIERYGVVPPLCSKGHVAGGRVLRIRGIDVLTVAPAKELKSSPNGIRQNDIATIYHHNSIGAACAAVCVKGHGVCFLVRGSSAGGTGGAFQLSHDINVLREPCTKPIHGLCIVMRDVKVLCCHHRGINVYRVVYSTARVVVSAGRTDQAVQRTVFGNVRSGRIPDGGVIDLSGIYDIAVSPLAARCVNAGGNEGNTASGNRAVGSGCILGKFQSEGSDKRLLVHCVVQRVLLVQVLRIVLKILNCIVLALHPEECTELNVIALIFQRVQTALYIIHHQLGKVVIVHPMDAQAGTGSRILDNEPFLILQALGCSQMVCKSCFGTKRIALEAANTEGVLLKAAVHLALIVFDEISKTVKVYVLILNVNVRVISAGEFVDRLLRDHGCTGSIGLTGKNDNVNVGLSGVILIVVAITEGGLHSDRPVGNLLDTVLEYNDPSNGVLAACFEIAECKLGICSEAFHAVLINKALICRLSFDKRLEIVGRVIRQCCNVTVNVVAHTKHSGIIACNKSNADSRPRKRIGNVQAILCAKNQIIFANGITGQGLSKIDEAICLLTVYAAGECTGICGIHLGIVLLCVCTIHIRGLCIAQIERVGHKVNQLMAAHTALNGQVCNVDFTSRACGLAGSRICVGNGYGLLTNRIHAAYTDIIARNITLGTIGSNCAYAEIFCSEYAVNLKHSLFRRCDEGVKAVLDRDLKGSLDGITVFLIRNGNSLFAAGGHIHGANGKARRNGFGFNIAVVYLDAVNGDRTANRIQGGCIDRHRACHRLEAVYDNGCILLHIRGNVAVAGNPQTVAGLGAVTVHGSVLGNVDTGAAARVHTASHISAICSPGVGVAIYGACIDHDIAKVTVQAGADRSGITATVALIGTAVDLNQRQTSPGLSCKATTDTGGRIHGNGAQEGHVEVHLVSITLSVSIYTDARATPARCGGVKGSVTLYVNVCINVSAKADTGSTGQPVLGTVCHVDIGLCAPVTGLDSQCIVRAVTDIDTVQYDLCTLLHHDAIGAHLARIDIMPAVRQGRRKLVLGRGIGARVADHVNVAVCGDRDLAVHQVITGIGKVDLKTDDLLAHHHHLSGSAHGHVGEVGQREGHVAGFGIVQELVTVGIVIALFGRQLCLGIHTVHHITVVVKLDRSLSFGHNARHQHGDGGGIALGNALDHNVIAYGLIQGHVGVNVVLIDLQLQTLNAVRKQRANGNGYDNAVFLVTKNDRLGQLAVCIYLARNGCLHLKVVEQCGEGCFLIVLIVKAVLLVLARPLGRADTDIELATNGKSLILVAGSLAHLQRDTEVSALLCLKRAVGGLLQRVDELRQVAHKGIAVKIAIGGIGKLACAGANVNIDHVGQNGKLRFRLKGCHPLERKIAQVFHLKHLYVHVAGLPKVIVKDRRLVFLYGVPSATLLVKQQQIHLQRTCLDLVARAGYLVGKPRKGRAKQHCEAKQQCYDACQQ